MRADYDTHVTLVFAAPAKAFQGNPFDIETPYGKPQTVGVGNAFAEMDQYREALEIIADGEGDAQEIARQALELATS